MADRLLVDVTADGLVSVSTWLDGEFPSVVGEPVKLAWPLTADELEDLRWYLEDYLRAPFGVYEQRGPQIAVRLSEWGQRMFSAVFAAEAARDAYVAVRTRATAAGVGERPEIVMRSAAPGWLGLPWELLTDPNQPAPVALDAATISRSLPSAQMGQAFPVSGQRLRVLMVISRPAGTGDVGYRMIARPLLDRLDAVRGVVELVVLRPPTLQALVDALQEAHAADAPFQVVHFDGHGVLAGRRAGVGVEQGSEADGSGMLVFEKPGGGADAVAAEEVARVLGAAKVPLVVLNACQSGAIGKRLEAAVATRLLAGGASSVVAMAYSVYAVAAAEFMAAFYERLFAGDRISDAVTAGRARLAHNALRPSPKGKMPLSDWLVPVHYLRRDAHFPSLRPLATHSQGGLSLDAALDRIRDHRTGDSRDPLAAGSEFVGRDGLFYTLEATIRWQRAVVLYGPGGTGKTELAKAFGRWWRDTGGVVDPKLVIWHSFAPGVDSFGLDGVLSSIGRQVYGVEFARLDATQRLDVVRDLLTHHHALVVLDNFESVHSMPDPTAATPPLDTAGCGEIRNFLAGIAGSGTSGVIITSRNPETWLGDIRRIPVAGLSTEEAFDYAELLLRPYQHATTHRAQRVFGELMEWLDGHPLSMRLILPQLDTTAPHVLLAGLRGTAALPTRDDDDQTTSLSACITYSIAHLDLTTRRLLAAVCLFHGVADVTALSWFSQHSQVPDRFRDINAEAWKKALDSAAGVGLLTPLGTGMYGIHPALPSYLADQWRAEDLDHYPAQRAAAIDALLDAHAALASWLEQQIHGGDVAVAFGLIESQRRTFTELLSYALDSRRFDRAYDIVRLLTFYWDAHGLYIEARGWVDRARLALEDPDGTPPSIDIPAGTLWRFLVCSEADRLRRTGHLDLAEDTYTQVRDALIAQPTSPHQQADLAVCYHQLGMIAQDRGRLDNAKDYYLKSLTIHEDLGRPSAPTYHQLGTIARHQGRLDEAKDYYLKSLTIHEDLGDRIGMAINYNGLGVIAHNLQRLDEAENYYHKALTINRDVGDRRGMAVNYDGLAGVAYGRGQLDSAEDYCLKSLTIHEDLGDRIGMADNYHVLGIIAQDRGRLDDAENWHHKSLTIHEDSGNRFHMARGYQLLGMLAHDRGRLDDAENWHHKSLTIHEDFGDRAGMALAYHRLGLIAEDRGRLDNAEHWHHKSLTINKDLGDRAGIATNYHRLGILAHEQRRLGDAEDYYLRSLTIHEDLGDRAGMANNYHPLGILAHEQRRLDDAEHWHHKSLATSRDLGDRPGMALAYHRLGLIAQDRGQLGDAEDYYLKFLTVNRDLGDRAGMASAFGQLGLLADVKGRSREALKWLVRCIAMFDEFPHPATVPVPEHLARLTTSLGLDMLRRSWREVTGQEPPLAVISFIKSHQTQES